jgi:hypothetical protein
VRLVCIYSIESSAHIGCVLAVEYERLCFGAKSCEDKQRGEDLCVVVCICEI